MSRGFVREDDQEEVPMVPPRADLPEGVTNYVTRAGMDELKAEKQTLENERKNLSIQIVGVDEADFSKGKIAFTSPLARILINKKVGEKAILERAGEKTVFEVMSISYG